MAISRISTSSIQQNFPKSTSFWDLTSVPENGAYDSIATANPTSGSSISFTFIPQTYKHLQLRAIWNPGTTSRDLQLKVNTTAPTQAHYMQGAGSVISVGSSDFDTNGWYISLGNFNASYNNYPSAFVIDFLDYSDTNKNKTARALAGIEYNSGDTKGRVGLKSAFWNSTSVISSIEILQSGSAFGSIGNSFALYGIKG
jgi:hypothetical protein